MKKSLLLAAMLAVALSACGKKEEAKPAAAPAAPAADAKPADSAAPAAAPAAPAAALFRQRHSGRRVELV